eukprot:scaffold1455_cov152-Isochrysis_galbana.AAC.1
MATPPSHLCPRVPLPPLGARSGWRLSPLPVPYRRPNLFCLAACRSLHAPRCCTLAAATCLPAVIGEQSPTRPWRPAPR